MPVLTPAELWETTGRDRDPRALPPRGPRRPALRPPADARGDGHLPRAGAPELQGAAAALVPLPDEGPRRAAPARRPDPRARVHHEGLLLVRPRRGRASSASFERTAARTTGSSSAAASRRTTSGRVRDDGRQRVRRLPRARRARARTRSSRARTATTRPTWRSRAAIPRPPEFPQRLDAPEEVETPGVTTIEALARVPRHRPGGDVEGDARREQRRHARARARPRRRPARGGQAPGGARSGRPARDRRRDPRGLRRRPAARSARSASTGEVIADEALREGQFVAGANRTGWHLRGVEAGRDYEPRFADLRAAEGGRHVPECGGALQFQTAIEVGHIFKLGTRYSVPLGATFLDEDGSEKPLVDGQLRHRPRRGSWRRSSSRATTRTGSSGPRAIAPYDVHVVALAGVEEQARAGRGGARRRRARRPARRPRPAAGREVRRRRPDRAARSASRSGRRPSRTAPSTSATARRARSDVSALPIWARSRLDGRSAASSATSRSARGRAADERDRRHLPGLAAKTGLSAGLSQPPRARQPPGAVERRRRDASQRRSASSPSTSASTALRVITERLEAMPELIDRLYRRLEG